MARGVARWLSNVRRVGVRAGRVRLGTRGEAVGPGVGDGHRRPHAPAIQVLMTPTVPSKKERRGSVNRRLLGRSLVDFSSSDALFRGFDSVKVVSVGKLNYTK